MRGALGSLWRLAWGADLTGDARGAVPISSTTCRRPRWPVGRWSAFCHTNTSSSALQAAVDGCRRCVRTANGRSRVLRACQPILRGGVTRRPPVTQAPSLPATVTLRAILTEYSKAPSRSYTAYAHGWRRENATPGNRSDRACPESVHPLTAADSTRPRPSRASAHCLTRCFQCACCMRRRGRRTTRTFASTQTCCRPMSTAGTTCCGCSVRRRRGLLVN